MKIDYVEFQSAEFEQTREFFSKAFGWSYTDFGPDYAEIGDAGLTGGIERSEEHHPPLVILKTDDLEAAQDVVQQAGGVVTVPIFSFPGGRRFHFREPGGNVLAVWTEIEA